MKDTLYPGGLFHVYTRGNNKESLFKAQKNYAYFLGLWKKHIIPMAEVYAYCLMPNHIHFCIRIRPEEVLPLAYREGKRHLSQPFSNCFNAYTKAINKAYGRTGSLFEETYRRKEVTDEDSFLRLVGYIHANPQHHGFCSDFRTYPHTSYQSLLSTKPTDLSRAELLTLFGSKKAFIRFHEEEKNWRSFLSDA